MYPGNTIIYPIAEDDRQESYVYRSNIDNTCQKVYWRLSELNILRYATLQNSIEDSTLFLPDTEKPLTVEGKHIKSMVLKILDIPYMSYEVCFIGEGKKKGLPGRITHPEYIGGENFREFVKRNRSQEDMDFLIFLFNHLFFDACREAKVYGAEFIFENAKVQFLEDGVLELTITDIASDTKHLIGLNDSVLYRYINIGIQTIEYVFLRCFRALLSKN